MASPARRVLIAAVLAFALGQQGMPAQEVRQSPESRARAFVELMAGGQHGTAFEWFTPQMKEALPLESRM